MDGWDYGTENVSCFNINPEMLQGAGCPDSGERMTPLHLQEGTNGAFAL